MTTIHHLHDDNNLIFDHPYSATVVATDRHGNAIFVSLNNRFNIPVHLHNDSLPPLKTGDRVQIRRVINGILLEMKYRELGNSNLEKSEDIYLGNPLANITINNQG